MKVTRSNKGGLKGLFREHIYIVKYKGIKKIS